MLKDLLGPATRVKKKTMRRTHYRGIQTRFETERDRYPYLHPTPYALHPTHCTLHLTPYTLHPTPCILHPAPYTRHPTPYTLMSHFEPFTLHSTASEKEGKQATTLNPNPASRISTPLPPLHPTPYTQYWRTHYRGIQTRFETERDRYNLFT